LKVIYKFDKIRLDTKGDFFIRFRPTQFKTTTKAAANYFFNHAIKNSFESIKIAKRETRNKIKIWVRQKSRMKSVK